MALLGGGCFGAAQRVRPPAVGFEAMVLVDALSGANRWGKRLSGELRGIEGDFNATQGQDEHAVYIYDDFAIADGDKMGGLGIGTIDAAGNDYHFGRLGKPGNKWVAAIYRSNNDGTLTVLGEGTTQFSPNAVYLMNVRFDGTNIVYYIDGVAQITLAHTNRPGVGGLGFSMVYHYGFFGQRLSDEPAGLVMYYNTGVAATGLAGDFAGRFPEVRDAHPNAAGFYNDFTGVPETVNKHLNWDDLVGFADHDGDISYNFAGDALLRQTSGFADTTMTNALCVTRLAAFLRVNVAGKVALGIGLLCRQNAVDLDKDVTGIVATGYVLREAVWGKAPDASVWTQAKFNAAEWGVRRNAGVALNLQATAIGLEVGAMGATEFRPGAPAIAADDPRRLLARMI